MRSKSRAARPLLVITALLTAGLAGGLAAGDWPAYDIGAPGKPKPTGRTRVFNLEARQATWELMPGVKTTAITYNGTVPGPLLRVTEGDTVRVTIKNSLSEDTSVHWHGLHVPNAQDGVPPFTQKPIKPGQSFTYQFVASHAGTFMYHSHLNSVRQIDRGLYGAFIIDPQQASKTRFAREFTMMLGAWNVASNTANASGMGMAGTNGMAAAGSAGRQGSIGMMGAGGATGMMSGQGGIAMGGQAGTPDAASAEATPVPDDAAGSVQGGQMMPGMSMGGAKAGMMAGQAGMGHEMMGGAGSMAGMNYNYFTINGKAFPANPAWKITKGELVRVRILNISNLAHPMHLHGGDFTVIAKDGEPVRPSTQQTMNTLNVAPGESYDVAIKADEVGTWVFHCHELHHAENNGVEPGGLIQAIRVSPAAKAAPSAPKQPVKAAGGARK